MHIGSGLKTLIIIVNCPLQFEWMDGCMDESVNESINDLTLLNLLQVSNVSFSRILMMCRDY